MIRRRQANDEAQSTEEKDRSDSRRCEACSLHPGLSRQAILLIVAGIFLVWLSVGFGLPTWLLDEPAERGLFGDQFGTANALFSGFALAGVVLALLLQHRALTLQHQALRQAIEEQQQVGR